MKLLTALFISCALMAEDLPEPSLKVMSELEGKKYISSLSVEYVRPLDLVNVNIDFSVICESAIRASTGLVGRGTKVDRCSIHSYGGGWYVSVSLSPVVDIKISGPPQSVTILFGPGGQIGDFRIWVPKRREKTPGEDGASPDDRGHAPNAPSRR